MNTGSKMKSVRRSILGKNYRVRALAMALVASAGASSESQALLFNDAATGNWNAGATWGNAGNNVEGSGFPGAGDHIRKDTSGATITVTANQSFGDSTAVNASQFAAGAASGTIIVNSGITLTHIAGSIIDQNNGAITFSGPGAFTNAGSFRADGDAGVRPVVFNGGLRFNNTGLFVADNQKPQININDAATLFSNSATVSGQNSGGDFIFQGTGTFRNEATGIVENPAAGTSKLIVNTSRIESNGGNWNAADTQSIGLGTTVTSTLNGTFNGTTAGTGAVRLEGTVIMDGDVVFNIGGPLGTLFRTNDGNINLGANGKLINQGAMTIQGGSNGTENLLGTGIFRNAGTLNHNSDGMYIGVKTGQAVENNGVWTLQNKGGIDLVDAGTEFRMNNDGIFQSSSTGSPAGTKGAGRIVSSGGQFKIITGATQNLELFGGADSVAGGSVIQAHVGGATFDAIASREIQLGGFYSEVSGQATGAGLVRLSNGPTFLAAGTSVNLNVTGNGVRWYTGNVNFAGDEIINNGKITYNSDRRHFQNGLLTNNGTFEHLTTAFGGQEFEVLSATFDNNGLHSFPSNGKVEINNGVGPGTYNNKAGGIIRVDNNVNSDVIQFFGNGTFNNLGIVEVRQEEIEFDSALLLPQFETTPGTLTGGTWIANDADGAGANFARIDVLGVTNLTTIGSAAKVVLAGPSSFFDRVNTVTTVRGTFLVSDRTFAISGGTLTLDGGTIGGTGTFTGNIVGTGAYSPGNSAGNLTISGSALWAGGSSYLFEIGDPTGSNPVASAGLLWDLLTAGTLNITATAGLPFDIQISALDLLATTQSWSAMIAQAGSINGFNPAAFSFTDVNAAFNGSFAIEQRQNQLFLNFTPATTGGAAVPEPTTLGLTALTLAALARRRRPA